MKLRLLVAHALASAFSIGPWKPAALRQLAADVIGADASWITPVVRAVRRHFPEPPEDEDGIARLAAVIASHSAFRAAFWTRQAPHVRRWLAAPPTMGVTPWPVPPAATLPELGQLLEVEPRELEWLADARRYLRRRKSPLLDHYHRKWLAKRSGVAWLEAVTPARGAKLRALFDAIDWSVRPE